MRAIAQSKGKRTALYACMYMVGVGLGSVVHMPLPLAVAGMIVAVAMYLQDRWMVWWSCGMLCLGVLHMSWMHAHETSMLDHRLGVQEITGTITRDVEHRSDKQRAVMSDDVNGIDILVWLPPYPRVQTGDRIRTECVLAHPKPFNGFAYDEYLKTQNIWYQCDRAHYVEVVGVGDVSLKRALFVFKDNLHERMQRILPEPHASLLSGLLYGDHGGLSTSQKDVFAVTGTSHILAISGYNITMLTVMMLSLFTSLRISRKKAIWLALIMIGLFAMFVGSQSSVMRAAIMGMVPLFAGMIGRLTKPIYVLIHAATIMVLLNPRILMYDPGFQLSAAATAGLIIITPRLLKRSEWVPDAMNIKEAAISTIAANIATFPLIIYHFGRLSLISIPVNILVLPLMPLIMASGVLTILTLFVHQTLAVFVGTIPYVLMSCVFWIVDRAAMIPFAAPLVHMNAWSMVLAYGLLFYLLYQYKKQTSHDTVMCGGEVWIIREEKT